MRRVAMTVNADAVAKSVTTAMPNGVSTNMLASMVGMPRSAIGTMPMVMAPNSRGNRVK